MSTTTYSIGHAVARRLRSSLRVGLPLEWLDAVDRLEQGEVLDDLRHNPPGRARLVT